MLLGLLTLAFAAAAAAPLVAAVARSRAGRLLAVVPAALAVAFIMSAPGVTGGEPPTSVLVWAPALGLEVALRLDGLAALFAVLIATIGAAIFVYADGYLGGHRDRGRFFAYLMLFMAAMLGIVLADNLLLLYVCWELTTISSWLLIGFDHEKEDSRRAAWQALIVTSLGGLAMLAGFVLLGQFAGTYELSTILEDGDGLRASGMYLPVLGLVLIGAATKSALVPFHFWLPNAMAAPTPVSAYLHSATMVTAGVYLLARLHPVLGETMAWTYTVAGLGGVTAVIAAWLALMQSDIKRLLAYSTISALGMMTLALGIGGSHGARAAAVLLFAHALYKGALFMVAGAIDHGTGTRDLREVSGLRRALPATAIAALLAMASMVGLPPTLGFIAEESLVEVAHREAHTLRLLWLALAVASGALYTAAGFIVGLRPFFGRTRSPHDPHESGVAMWMPTLFIALAGVVLALLPGVLDRWLFSPAARAIAGEAPRQTLQLWHGVTVPFLLGVGMLIVGLMVCAAWNGLRDLACRAAALRRAGPDRLYNLMERGVLAGAARLDRTLQHGYLPAYLIIVALTILAVVARPLWHAGLSLPEATTSVRPFDLGIIALTLAALLGATIGRSRVAVITCMSLVGYGLAGIFAIFGGPDLAVTQVLVETLLTVLVILLLPDMPRFEKLASVGARVRDALLCALVGALIAGMLLTATTDGIPADIADYYTANSATRGGGRNIVNTILVNFRAADTLGEITVLSSAMLGAAMLLAHARRRRRRRRRAAASPRPPRPPMMIESLVLTVAAKVLLPLLIVFAAYLLLSGHHAPGGGFAAALVLASGLALYLFGSPRATEQELLRLRPRSLLPAGLLTAAGSGVIALAAGEPFLTAKRVPWQIPVLGGIHPGTALLFDFGVCLVAAGALFVALRAVEEHGPWRL